MKYLLCAALFGASFLFAQNPEDIIQTDSVTIYRVHPGYKFLRSKLPKGAIYLPRINEKRVTRQTALLTSIPIVVGLTAFAIDDARYRRKPYNDEIDFPIIGFVGFFYATESFIAFPSIGNYKYGDKKRAYLGAGMRLASLLLLANTSPYYGEASQSQKLQRIGGIGLGVAGLTYSFATIKKSRKAYQAKLRRYGITD
jgi:hypothetical protein